MLTLMPFPTTTTHHDSATDVTAQTIIESPVGPISVVVGISNEGIACVREVQFVKDTTRGQTPVTCDTLNECLTNATSQLREYFAGSLQAFDFPLDPRGTPFQKTVWRELCNIPTGTTINYGELARRVRGPNYARAVGAANGANPIVIVIPCHRVIDAKGKLHGYGGGLERKRWLLEHEHVLCGSSVFAESALCPKRPL